jgi:hypothetical protein
MDLVVGERLILKKLVELHSQYGFVRDEQLATAAHMHTQDVLDWLEILDRKGFGRYLM